MVFTRCVVLLGLLGFVSIAKAQEPVLLRAAADRWLAERDHWAFTQFVREYQDNQVKEERWERYDPSRPDGQRWELLKVDRREPTPEEREQWNKRKNKKHRHPPKPIEDYFDFDHARITGVQGDIVRYELPLRKTINWLFPTEKVEIIIAVNRATRAIEEVRARISEPFKVALGFARILDVDLDVQVPPAEAANPSTAQPDGTAYVVMTKMGERAEYSWSDFKRVN